MCGVKPPCMSASTLPKRALKTLRDDGLFDFITKSLNFLYKIIVMKYIPMDYYIRYAPRFWNLQDSNNSPTIQKTQHEGVYVITYPDGTQVFSPNPKLKTGRRLHTDDRMRDNSLPGFVSVDEGDVVIDVGSFIGAFSVGAAEDAEAVFAIEADPVNAYCTRQNTVEYENIETIQRAVWNESTSIDFHIGVDPTDSSILSPDFNNEINVVEVPAETLDTIFSRYKITEVDFLKMDVEGVEPEALEGMKDITPKKVAIDASAERDGEDTMGEVVDILEQRGYEIRTNPPMVFGKLEN